MGSELEASAADIILATANARYAHSAFGLRYLLANLGDLRQRTRLLEFEISQRAVDIAEQILLHQPRIVGLGVYLWNVTLTTELVSHLKRVQPDLVVVVGGPEVSHEINDQEICRLADHVITGEADVAFAALCQDLLEGERPREPLTETARGDARPPKVLNAPPPSFDDIALPYALYTADDIAQRVIYVEASRGCPFGCEFCLSSLDIPVRRAPLPLFLDALQNLLDRGARQFKFVDRTFNLDLKTSQAILEFFLDRYQAGLFVHFEMIPDRLPAALRRIIERFPPAALQFEVGIQTFNDDVAARINRRQDNVKVEENLRWLRSDTGVHVHADLIVGLPGEDRRSFAAGFDRLLALQPQEIQVGILKRLRGAPIARHTDQWNMVYSEHPPYEILQTGVIEFGTMQQFRRFARYWDLVANSGHFRRLAPMIWAGTDSGFESFWQFSDWLHRQVGQTHGIARARLRRLIEEYLVTERRAAEGEVREASIADERPKLAEHVPDRQARHLAGTDLIAPGAASAGRRASRSR